jgi:hypothetical protein
MKYKVINVTELEVIDLSVTNIKHNNQEYKTWNLLDPIEGDFFITKKGIDIPLDLNQIEKIADILCEYKNMSSDQIIIFQYLVNGEVSTFDRNCSYFLGSLQELDFADKEMFKFFESNYGIKIYY